MRAGRLRRMATLATLSRTRRGIDHCFSSSASSPSSWPLARRNLLPWELAKHCGSQSAALTCQSQAASPKLCCLLAETPQHWESVSSGPLAPQRLLAAHFWPLDCHWGASQASQSGRSIKMGGQLARSRQASWQRSTAGKQAPTGDLGRRLARTTHALVVRHSEGNHLHQA